MSPHLMSFARERRGSVALMFGLAVFVLFGLVGAAFDYSRAALVQSGLQRGVDAAALMFAKNREAQGGSYVLTDESAAELMRGTFDIAQVSGMTVRVTVNDDGVRVDASGSVRTTLSNVIGFRQLPVASSAEAVFTRVEIALVLDNTGSMNALNKLGTLKDAAHGFLNKMAGTVGSGNSVRIALVPFDTNVNLGDLKTSWWVDPATTAHWTANPGTSGCIWDREKPYDTEDTAPDGGRLVTLFGADQTRTRDCSIGAIQPLTGDFGRLHAAVDSMAGGGNTNTTIGLIWGYHVLTPAQPIANAAPLNTRNLSKYIIFMTDGDNTQNRWNNSSQATEIDARSRRTCDQIRSSGIQVFTARIIEGNAGLLQDCATTPDMYFDVQNVSQLEPAFNRIFAQITGMRLAR